MRPAPRPRQPDRRRPRPSRCAGGGRACTLLFAALALLGGCATEERVTLDGWARFKEMGDPKLTAAAGGGAASGTYTIMLERFVGAERFAKARALSQQLGSQGLPDVDVQDSAGITTVSVGRFADAGAPAAQAMLRKVRGMEIEGNRLYAGANFVAAEGGKKIYDPLDLKQYTGRHTLQIGFYDKRFQGDYKAAAEEAARVLREEGADAYYYHGPHRSLVCVGLFNEGDFEQAENPGGGFTVTRYGPRIREAQEKFPYNLGNGVTLIEKDKQSGDVIGEQPSCLVRVM